MRRSYKVLMLARATLDLRYFTDSGSIIFWQWAPHCRLHVLIANALAATAHTPHAEPVATTCQWLPGSSVRCPCRGDCRVRRIPEIPHQQRVGSCQHEQLTQSCPHVSSGALRREPCVVWQCAPAAAVCRRHRTLSEQLPRSFTHRHLVRGDIDARGGIAGFACSRANICEAAREKLRRRPWIG